jgi:hypothetical protein
MMQYSLDGHKVRYKSATKTNKKGLIRFVSL